MGFNRRKMEDQRRAAAEKEAASRRATDAQVLEDADRLIDSCNGRQAKRMPMLFSPTIGAAITARYWFLWVRCPACTTINAIAASLPERGSADLDPSTKNSRTPRRFRKRDSVNSFASPRAHSTSIKVSINPTAPLTVVGFVLSKFPFRLA